MQLQKQARKATKPVDPLQTHVVKIKQFNPVMPAAGVEMIYATLHERGQHIVVTSQRRAQ